MEAAAPDLQKIYEEKAAKKLSNSLLMLLGLHKTRDRQLVSLLKEAMIPPDLVRAKTWYKMMIRDAKSDRFRDVLIYIYDEIISPLVDMFAPYPVPIETILKDEATKKGEINVVGLPKGFKGSKSKYDATNIDRDDARDREIDRLEAELNERKEQAFVGPGEEPSYKGEEEEEEEEEEGEESPFLSFRRD